MKRLMALGAAALLAACAAKDNVEPPRALESFPASLSVTRIWNVSVRGAGDVRVGLQPAVGGDRVFIAGRDGHVVAIGLSDGRQAWSAALRRPLAGGPAFGDGLVVVGGSDGSVTALDANSGSVRWTAQLTGEVLAPPAVARGVVAVRTGDGGLFGLDGADGGVLWSYEQPVPSLSLRGTAGPVVAGDTVIAGFDNGRLAATHLRDGQLAWESAVAVATGRTEVERMVDVNHTPRVIGREVYAVTYQGRIAAVALETGRALWSQEFSSSSGLGAAALGIFATDQHSEVVGFDRLSGSPLWRQASLRARSLTAPTPIRDAVVVGDFDGFLHFLSQDSGELVARARIGNGAIRMAPVVAGDIVIAQTAGGSVTAYRVGD